MRIAVSIIALLMVGVLVVPSEAAVLGAVVDAAIYVMDSFVGASRFAGGAVLGANEMLRSYIDFREANFKNSDKFFHARGNFDAAQHGPGGIWAAKAISDGREYWQETLSGRGAEDTQADQFANRWGRYGGNPNEFLPEGLPDKYLSRNKWKESSPHP